MTTKIFVDSNTLIYLILGSEKQKDYLKKLFQQKIQGANLYINPIVISEVIFAFLRARTGKTGAELKTYYKSVKGIDLEPLRKMFSNFILLPITENVIDISFSHVKNYGLLPNDAIHLATCQFYGIKDIATFDTDFDRIPELEVWKP